MSLAEPDASQDNYSRFIVKYRGKTAVAEDRGLLPARLDATAASAGLDDDEQVPALRLHPLRRLALGAEVFTTSRPLNRDEATALMQAFGADSEVEYIEIDAMATIQSDR